MFRQFCLLLLATSSAFLSSGFAQATPSPQIADLTLRWRLFIEQPAAPITSNPQIVALTVTSPGDTSLASRALEEAGLRDHLLNLLGRSSVFRLVDQPAEADLILSFRVDRSSSVPRLFLNLKNRSNGASLHLFDAVLSPLPSAIAEGRRVFEQKLLTRAWTAPVIRQNANKLIIRRGSRDGLRLGAILNGFAVPDESNAEEDPEMLIALAGEPAGRYKLVNLREEIATFEPIEGAPVLAPGSILEAPAMPISEDPAPTRQRTAFDALYGK